MNPAEVSQVLAKAAAFDLRTVGQADVLAWLEAIGDLDVDDALAAVTRHYRDTTEWLKPAHIRQLVDDIQRERRRARREAAEERAALEAAPTRDRSAEVADLLGALRARLGPYDPTVLRRAEWVHAEHARRRDARPVQPNVHYQGPPPPGGWPVPEPEADSA